MSGLVGESYDLIWWNIFHGLQEKFVRATRNIIERPRHRLKTVASYKRADQIRRFTTLQEQQFAEHRLEESKLYLVEEQQHTHNTVENRFLKHALAVIQKRYSDLAKRVLGLSTPEVRRRLSGDGRGLADALRSLLSLRGRGMR